MKLGYLVKGTPGHPSHPPLTDATVGMYVLAAGLAVLSRLGVSEQNTATGWWLALVGALVVTAPTALAGLFDWLEITVGSPIWRTATLHLSSMVTATVFFLIAALVGHDDYVDRAIGNEALILTLVGAAFLSLGGWLGGSIVYVHGMRVLSLVDEPARRAADPRPLPEKEEAAES